jgi:hypothetical protein
MIENDMRAVGVCEKDIENREDWRFRTRVADPKYLAEKRRKRRRRKNK